MKKPIRIILAITIAATFAISLYFIGLFLAHKYWPFNREPERALIYSGFYKCEKDRVLMGGNFGKGPTIKLQDKTINFHTHEWRKIHPKKFKELALEWYSKDLTDNKDFQFLMNPYRDNKLIAPNKSLNQIGAKNAPPG